MFKPHSAGCCCQLRSCTSPYSVSIMQLLKWSSRKSGSTISLWQWPTAGTLAWKSPGVPRFVLYDETFRCASSNKTQHVCLCVSTDMAAVYMLNVSVVGAVTAAWLHAFLAFMDPSEHQTAVQGQIELFTHSTTKECGRAGAKAAGHRSGLVPYYHVHTPHAAACRCRAHAPL